MILSLFALDFWLSLVNFLQLIKVGLKWMADCYLIPNCDIVPVETGTREGLVAVSNRNVVLTWPN